MTSESTPRVAVVGAGAWGKNVVRTFHELGALAAIVDGDPTTRERCAEQYPDARVSGVLKNVLDDVDAVAVATPASTHAGVAREALAAGKDVYVEKPLTLDAQEARALTEEADRAGRVLMVGHLLLYHPAVTAIKQAIDAGRIGTLVSLHQERLKLGRVRRVENVLWSFGVHDVAVLLYLVGRAPDGVQATGQATLQEGIADDVHLHLDFGEGVRAHLHTSWLWPETRRRLHVVGTEAMLVYDELHGQITLHERHVDEALQHHDGGVEVLYERKDVQPLTLELQHFLGRVKDRAAPLSDGRNGVDVIDVLVRADAAMEAGL